MLAALAGSGVAHRVVAYGDVHSLEEAARQRSISIARLIKTMVVRLEDGYVLVLVPGDRQIDWAKLRAHLGVRRLTLADEADATAATGYPRGAITPFGAGSWPVLIDAAVPCDGEVSLGGGVRGKAIHLDGADLAVAVSGARVDVSKPA